jgi:conjugative relaxase-like TrwC/TraI family protein
MGTEVRGQWRGRAAARMGLATVADPVEIRRLASGEDPTAPGSKLAWIAGRGAAGWRLTVAAPRSVAIVGLGGPDPQLVAAHDRAIERAVIASEEAARSGLDSALTRSLVAAVFPHRYDSASGPVLEDRIFLFNITSVPGSAIPLSLQFEVPYEVREIIEATYFAELRSRVRALGYDVSRTGVTAFEITGAGGVSLEPTAALPWIEPGEYGDDGARLDTSDAGTIASGLGEPEELERAARLFASAAEVAAVAREGREPGAP